MDIAGKPMIQRVYEAALQATLIDRVIVATDDKRILDTVINFGGQAEGLRCPGGFTPVLLLAEYGAPFFPRLHEYCERSGTGPRRWRAEPAEEGLSAWVRDAGGRRMLVVAGRQVVTAERLEVLVLFAPQEVTAGQTAAQTVEAVLQAGALPVLPWSPGKWWGRRGEAVRRIVAEAGPNQLCLGDIKGRPLVWPSPAAFSLARRKGLKILRGSDPLDLPGGALQHRPVGRKAWQR